MRTVQLTVDHTIQKDFPVRLRFEGDTTLANGAEIHLMPGPNTEVRFAQVQSVLGDGAIIFDTMESTSKNLASISVPVYCLHGSEDHLVPLAASDGLAALPNVERRVWDGLRHECMNEPEQDQVLTELSDWIAAQLAMS